MQSSFGVRAANQPGGNVLSQPAGTWRRKPVVGRALRGANPEAGGQQSGSRGDEDDDPEERACIPAEVISDQNILGFVSPISIAQTLILLHVLFGVFYAAIALSGLVFFDFVGMLNFWCTLFVLLVVFEIVAYVVYLRMVRSTKCDEHNPQLPLTIVGKPMLREINLGLLASLYTVFGTTWIAIQYVVAGEAEYGVIGTPQRDDPLQEFAYLSHLLVFLILVLLASQPLFRAVEVHIRPLNTVTPFAKVEV